MYKKIFVLIFIGVFMISCGKGNEEAKKFSADYKTVIEQLREKRSQVKTRDEYAAFKSERKTELEALLKKFEKSPADEPIELIRSKIYLELQNLDEAEKKIDAILAEKPEDPSDAKMVKTKILLARDKAGEAYEIFKEIEPQITDRDDLFYAYEQFATELEDAKTREQYARKFLDAKEIPESAAKNKHYMYFYLSEAVKQQGNLEEAKKALNDGIAVTEGEREKKFLQTTLGQLEYLGKKAFPFTAPHWINSEALDIGKLEGKVVILTFWAPWCPSCRKLTPTLVDLYNENKDKGLEMIGCTRFYGTYRDDEGDKGKVDKEEELELIKGYVERKQLPYPVAVEDGKEGVETYNISGLPTLVFIDKKGNIDYTDIGGADVQFLKDKIKTLLEAI